MRLAVDGSVRPVVPLVTVEHTADAVVVGGGAEGEVDRDQEGDAVCAVAAGLADGAQRAEERRERNGSVASEHDEPYRPGGVRAEGRRHLRRRQPTTTDPAGCLASTGAPPNAYGGAKCRSRRAWICMVTPWPEASAR